MSKRKWRLKGFDSSSEESYPILGEYDSEKLARDAARLKCAEIELTQPTLETGGQDEDGIQDKIYIVRPNGSTYLFHDDPPSNVPPQERVS